MVLAETAEAKSNGPGILYNLDVMGTQIEKLWVLVNLLEERLNPVLLFAAPEQTALTNEVGDIVEACNVALTVFNLTNSIQGVQMRLNNIISRLGI